MKFSGKTFGSECFEAFRGRVPRRGDNNVVCFRELSCKSQGEDGTVEYKGGIA